MTQSTTTTNLSKLGFSLLHDIIWAKLIFIDLPSSFRLLNTLLRLLFTFIIATPFFVADSTIRGLTDKS